MSGFLPPEGWEAVFLSLRVAVVASALGLPCAVGVAFALERGRFRGRGLLNGLVHLPLILPPVVTGYALLMLFGRQGVVGSALYAAFGVTFAFNWTGAALAAGVMAFPLMVRAVRLSLEGVSPNLEAAAGALGASPLRVFTTISLPLMLPGIFGGFILGFAKALGEFGATITFVSSIPGQTRTLPSAIYGLLQVPNGEEAALRLVLVSVVLAVGALAASEYLARRVRKRREGQR